eukprot:1124441_1
MRRVHKRCTCLTLLIFLSRLLRTHANIGHRLILMSFPVYNLDVKRSKKRMLTISDQSMIDTEAIQDIEAVDAKKDAPHEDEEPPIIQGGEMPHDRNICIQSLFFFFHY